MTVLVMQAQVSEGIIALQVIVLLGQLILFAFTRIAAKRERENIAEQVKLYRQARIEGRLIDSLAECHSLLMEGLDTINSIGDISDLDYRLSLQRHLRSISASLQRLSWMCGDLGTRIRRSAGGFQSHAKYRKPAAHVIQERSGKLAEEISNWLVEVLSEGLVRFLKE